MARFLPVLTTVAAVAVAIYAMPARAAGPYDGQWVLDAPPAGGAIGAEGEYTCPAIRIPFTIRDNQVEGYVHRAVSAGETTYESGQGPGASPITGSVNGSGQANVTWENFHFAGQLNGNAGTASWAGECGPRTGTLTKVGQ